MIRWFKELFKLVGWLFTSRPSEVQGKPMEVVQMKHFPFSGYRYMMWCGRIITRHPKEAISYELCNTEKGRRSLTHEGGHCVQAISEHRDNWLRFYWMYFIQWIKRNPLVYPASACYYCNRYEVEAYANEDNPEYWIGYSRGNLKGKYDIKNAKKLYRQMGKRKWKEYIKTL